MAGGTLSDLFARAAQDHRPLSIARIAALGSEIAQSLAEVHDHGIIHGDVQPKNVWFDAPDGTVHLGDFDLAIRVGAAPHSLRHARTNRSCMAPEILAGKDASTQSDLYSLGATLYEEATGQPLFSGSEHEVEQQHLEVEPADPSQFRSDLPRPVCDLLLRLLAKDPAKRPPGATKVAQALAAVARAEQATADLGSLITTGEGPHIEFKETFRAPTGPPPPAVTSDHIAEWTATQIDKVELASLTAIAGFMNTDGGWLLIGVRDDSSVAGIEPDHEHMKRRRADQSERDAWELCFRDVVRARLGEGAPFNISVNLNEHNAKTVALVRCERASAATFIDGKTSLSGMATALRSSRQSKRWNTRNTTGPTKIRCR